MIHKLTYVSCDRCGSFPTNPVSGTAEDAREVARSEGYRRIRGQDVCPQCLHRRAVEGRGS